MEGVPGSDRQSCVSIQRRRRSDRKREAGAIATLSRAGDVQGRDRAAPEDQQEDGVQLDRGRASSTGAWTTRRVRYRPRAPQPSKLDPFKEIIRTRLADYAELSAVRLFDELKAGGLPGGVRAGEALRPRGPPTGSCGAGGEVRDPTGPPGPGGLRGVQAAVGQAPRADRGAWVLAADVAQVLRASDDDGRDPRDRGVVPLLRRGSGGVAVSTR